MHVTQTRARPASPRTRLAIVLAAVLLASLFGLAASTATARPALGASTFHSLELYAQKLLNCSRTGGSIRSDGTCAGYGSGSYSTKRAALPLRTGLSSVARSWAKHLVATDACQHGDLTARLRTAGYSGSAWGENIGCSDYGTAKNAVLQSFLAFQREKASNGGHWRNIKNAAYASIGIGVWKANGRSRVVIDFYRP